MTQPQKLGSTARERCQLLGLNSSGSDQARTTSIPGLCTAIVMVLLSVTALTVLPIRTWAEEPPAKPQTKPELPFKPGANWMRLTVDHEVWIDLKKKELLVGGRVCLREGMLEMFACPKGTKEHEAVVAANTAARYAHAGLVALGAKPGPPVQFQPEYKPAQGTEIEITVIWKDQQGKEHRVRAQEWVKHTKTGKALEYAWVFAGSGFWVDEQAGERYYYADGGEFICVSNFSTAMLDLPIESSDANETLMFTAFTERIPPRETRVYLLLTPKLPPAQPVKKPATEPSAAAKPVPATKSPASEETAKKPPSEAREKVPPAKKTGDDQR